MRITYNPRFSPSHSEKFWMHTWIEASVPAVCHTRVTCNNEVRAHWQSCVRTVIIWHAASVFHRVQGLCQQSVASFCWGHLGGMGH